MLSASFKNRLCSEVWLDGHYLRWETGSETKKLGKLFLEKLSSLENSKEALVSFFREYGPLWGGNKIIISKALSMIRAFQLLYLLRGEAVSPGDYPRQAEEIDSRFFNPLGMWQEIWEKATGGLSFVLPAEFEENPLMLLEKIIEESMMANLKEAYMGQKQRGKKGKLWLLVGDNGETFFLPVRVPTKSWPLFSPPPKLETWEERKEWLYDQLIKNAVTLLQQELILKWGYFKNRTAGEEEKFRFPKGRAKVYAVPANAFAWILAKVVLLDVVRCPVCGRITGNSRYCSRSCEMEASQTGGKQRFLDYLNKQFKRGKLTEEEYNYSKDTVGRVFRKGIKEKTLRDKTIKALGERWKDKDFSFLEGFGSRRT